MPSRNLAAEKNAVDVFAKTKGKLPNNSQDWADVHKMAYPSINDLPDEFQKTEAASYYAVPGAKPTAANPTGASIAPTNPLPQDSSAIPGLQGGVNSAKANLDQLSSPNSALNILQEAIKTKTQSAQAPIGESSIFKQAGVDGFGALSNSLAARGTELSTNATDFKNIVGQMAGTYKDMASTAMTRYEAARDAYNAEVSRIQQIQNDLRDNEQAIKLAKLQHDMQMDLARFNKNNPTVGEQISAADKGLEITNGVVTDPSKGVVGGFDIGRYATDPNHERAVASIVQGIGKFNTLDEVQSYIQRKYPNSPVTAEMIGNAAGKYGVPWEMLVAMMEQDSSLGTQGKGARTFNPGNVGNDDAGNIKNYGDWQSGVNAVASWLDRHRATPAASSGSAMATAQAIFDGTSNLRVSDLPTAKRDAVNQELVKLKQAAIASGDTEGMIRASAGGSPPSDAFKTSFEKGINVVSQIGDLKSSVDKEATGPIWGIVRSKNPYDTKAQLIKAQLSAIVPNLARGVYGEVGVLTDNDVAQYSKTLPTLTSTDDVNKLVLGATIRSVQRSLENKLRVQAGSGTDVSGLLSVYQQVKAQADALLGPEGAGGGSVVQSPSISAMSSDWDSTFGGNSNSTASGVK